MSKKSPELPETWPDGTILPSEGFCLSLPSGQILLGCGLRARGATPEPGAWNFYLPDFFLEDPQPWWTPEEVFFLASHEEQGVDGLTNRINASWNLGNQGSFFSQFEDLQQLFAQGELRKAVPVVVAQSEWVPSSQDVAQLILRAQSVERAHPALHTFGFWTPSEGMIGLTPELLFQLSGSQLQTMALAGTRRSGFPAGELLADKKERAEHQIVVEDLHQRLSELGTVNMGNTDELNLGTLTHLKTDLFVELKSSHVPNFEDCVRLLHPTPALGAYPRQAGLQWLRKNRTRQAPRFGAPFGVSDPEGNSWCLVAIRNLQWSKQGSLLPVGCGVVAQSQAEAEWRELELKKQFVLESLGL
ncbi:MAG: chorismate-binding protein [Bdellovibrionaceae bacterium]|nr:chorismate-binding protein [Bdellovibrionales bacterium]MCB9084957.1 chorismate-binding protein [Pseudobdellovibrionaceae bacterium]